MTSVILLTLSVTFIQILLTILFNYPHFQLGLLQDYTQHSVITLTINLLLKNS